MERQMKITKKSQLNVGVLKLDMAWRPVAWISPQKAAKYYETNKILNEIGSTCAHFMGGVNRKTQEQSHLEIKPIIVVKGKLYDGKNFFKTPGLTNDLLFKRDKYTCAYCGNLFSTLDLSRDHVVPKFQKGKDIWQNVVTSCKPCNHKKANRTPTEADMALLFDPYVPSYIDLFLMRKNLLPEQSEFLQRMKQ